MNNVPFWWVVKHRDGGYLGEHVDKHVQHQREAGRNWAREDAQFAADWWDDDTHHVVKVHARIPEPKLPAWVKRVSIGSEQVAVIRCDNPRGYDEWLFHVDHVGRLAPVGQYVHVPRNLIPIGGFTAAPPDVWAEAAQRAAKMLRARKAAR